MIASVTQQQVATKTQPVCFETLQTQLALHHTATLQPALLRPQALRAMRLHLQTFCEWYHTLCSLLVLSHKPTLVIFIQQPSKHACSHLLLTILPWLLTEHILIWFHICKEAVFFFFEQLVSDSNGAV